NDGLDLKFFNDTPQPIVTDPKNPNFLFVGVSAYVDWELWATSTAGAVWGPAVLAHPAFDHHQVVDVLVDPRASSAVYAVTVYGFLASHYTAGVWESRDHGLSWRDTGIPALVDIQAAGLLVEPDSGRLFAGGADGVWAAPTNPVGAWTRVGGVT